MKDLAIVNMLKTQADLGEPIEDLAFLKVTASLVLDHLL
jgi:hypothetical protein